jgi:hypothetical protein
MYVHQRIERPGASLGLGWLADFAASSDMAEARRLKDEMTNLARRPEGPEWRGIERAYRSWFELRPAEDWEVHNLAAQAAGQLGDGGARYRRLLRALAANPWPEGIPNLKSDKESMDSGWANVDIRLRGKATANLQPVGGLPIDPYLRSAIVRAGKELRESAKFQGFLPAVPYDLDGNAVALGPLLAISRVSEVDIRQKGDGSFQVRARSGAWDPRKSMRRP